jgi:hypothetical protein
MKRLVPLLFAVVALTAVPVALADSGGSAPTAPARAAVGHRPAGHPIVRMRLEILRLRVRIVRIRATRICMHASSDRCTAFLQKVEQQLQTLDGNVQKKLDELKACTSTSTDQTCKNADRKIAVLTKVDAKLQALIQKIQDRLDGSSTESSSSNSSLTQAATGLGQAAGSLGTLGSDGSNGSDVSNG